MYIISRCIQNNIRNSCLHALSGSTNNRIRCAKRIYKGAVLFGSVKSERAEDGCYEPVLANYPFCFGGGRQGSRWPIARCVCATLAVSEPLLLQLGQPNLADSWRSAHTADEQ
jgi:hypothetical protein